MSILQTPHRVCAIQFICGNHRAGFHHAAILNETAQLVRIPAKFVQHRPRCSRQRQSVAALLHDSTKKLDLPAQLALCQHYGIQLDEMEQWALKLLHSKTGAAIARDVFGVDDEIYRAIWYHTTGHANMTLLEKIIYLADYIEPSRDFPGVDRLRKTCYEDLDAGLLLGLEMTVEEMTAMGNPVHHATLEARDALKGQ